MAALTHSEKVRLVDKMCTHITHGAIQGIRLESIDHLGVAPAGHDIFASARVYRSTRRVLFVEGAAFCESRDRPVARATGSWVLRGEFDPDASVASVRGAASP